MERKKVIVLAVLTVSVAVWRMGAMQQGEPGSSSSQTIILETKDGKETPVAMNAARLFGFINDNINERPEYPMVTLRTITKPVLDRLLAEIPFLLRRYQTNDPAIILSKPLEERRKKIQFFMADAPLSRMNLQRTLELLQAAYDLEMPELITQYAMAIASLLTKRVSSEWLNNGDYTLLTTIQQQPVALQNIIKQCMGHIYTGPVSSRNLQSIDTVEKELWLTLLAVYHRNGADYLNMNPWVVDIWRNLNEHDKNMIRNGYPQVAERLDQAETAHVKAAWFRK